MNLDKESQYLANKVFDYFLIANVYISNSNISNVYKKLYQLGYAHKKRPTKEEQYDCFRNFLIGKGLLKKIKSIKVNTYRKVKTKLTADEARGFYQSWEWKRVRYEVIRERGSKCEVCGATSKETRIVVDHIKPLRIYPELALLKSNLQVLCDDCNKGKSNFEDR